MPPHETCNECGFIHPPVAGGCPMKKAEKMKETGKGSAIVNFTSKLRDLLEASEDYVEKIDMIKKILKI